MVRYFVPLRVGASDGQSILRRSSELKMRRKKLPPRRESLLTLRVLTFLENIRCFIRRNSFESIAIPDNGAVVAIVDAFVSCISRGEAGKVFVALESMHQPVEPEFVDSCEAGDLTVLEQRPRPLSAVSPGNSTSFLYLNRNCLVHHQGSRSKP